MAMTQERCPVCGCEALLELVDPTGLVMCPRCGGMLRWFRECYGPHVSLLTSFREDLGADSLDVVELMMELEGKFGLEIPEEEIKRIETVGEMIELIERYQEAAHAE